MTENAPGTRIVGGWNRSPAEKRIPRFDFPIEQTIPAEGVFEGNENQSCNLQNNNAAQDPFNDVCRFRQIKSRVRDSFRAPAKNCQRQTAHRNDHLQDQTRTKHSADPQQQRNGPAPKQPTETSALDRVNAIASREDGQCYAKTRQKNDDQSGKQSNDNHGEARVTGTRIILEPSFTRFSSHGGGLTEQKRTPATMPGFMSTSSLSTVSPGTLIS